MPNIVMLFIISPLSTVYFKFHERTALFLLTVAVCTAPRCSMQCEPVCMLAVLGGGVWSCLFGSRGIPLLTADFIWEMPTLWTLGRSYHIPPSYHAVSLSLKCTFVHNCDISLITEILGLGSFILPFFSELYFLKAFLGTGYIAWYFKLKLGF